MSVLRLDELAEAALAGLLSREQADTRAHEIHSIDALDERAIHALLARGLRKTGQTVLREVAFPSQIRSGRRRNRAALLRERERCDLVILPTGATALADGVEIARDEDQAEGTLFQGAAPPEQHGTDPQDAVWIEWKIAGQHRLIDGVLGQDRGYSKFPAACERDLRKLARDPMIEWGIAGLVLFTADRAIAEHDLTIMMHRLLDRDAPVREGIWRSGEIGDRIGNACCTVAMLRARPELDA